MLLKIKECSKFYKATQISTFSLLFISNCLESSNFKICIKTGHRSSWTVIKIENKIAQLGATFITVKELNNRAE